jgi:hypothetical protein
VRLRTTQSWRRPDLLDPAISLAVVPYGIEILICRLRERALHRRHDEKSVQPRCHSERRGAAMSSWTPRRGVQDAQAWVSRL